MALTHHYLFNTLTTYNDSTGTDNFTNNFGSINGSGKINQCYQATYNMMNTISAYSSVNLLPASGSFSISFWLYPYSSTSASGIFNIYDGTFLTTALRLYGDPSTGDITFYDNSMNVHTLSGVMTYNAWNHISIIWNGSAWSYYVNAASQTPTGTAPNPSNAYSSNCAFHILGENSSGGYYWDDLRIYNSAITGTDVSNIYNSGTGTEADNPGGGGNPSISLSVATNPTKGYSTKPVFPQPVINVLNSGGTTEGSATDTVFASIVSGAATAGGSTSVAAISGVATFSGLTVTGFGTVGLGFTASGLSGAYSTLFNVTIPNPVIPIRSEVAGTVPTSGNLQIGELAINIADQKGFIKKSDGSIVTIFQAGAVGSGAVTSGSIASGQVGQFHLASGSVTSGRLGDASVVSGSIGSGQIQTYHIGSTTAPSSGYILQLNGTALQYNAVPAAVISSGQITSGMIGDNAVLSGSIASGTIGTFHFSSGGVLSGNIASGQIGLNHLGSGSVASGAIASGSISRFKISSGAVNSGQVGNNAVVSGSIASGQIGTFHVLTGGLLSGAIGSGQIGSQHIASGGVLSGNIASGQIGLNHLSSGSVTSGAIASGQITNFKMASGAILSGHVGDNAVVSGSIGSGQIQTYHIGSTTAPTSGYVLQLNGTAAQWNAPPAGTISSGQVTSGMIGNNAVVSGSVASGSIGSVHLTDGAVTSGDISSGQVGNAHIASGGVLSGNIASGQIGTFHITTGGLFSGAIGSGQIGSQHIASGGVLSGNIASGQIGFNHLSSGSVGSGSIASGQITNFKMASGAILSGHVGNNAVVSGSIGSGQIQTYHIGSTTTPTSGYVLQLNGTAAQWNLPPAATITSGQITSGYIGNNAVVSGSIASGQVSKFAIESGSIFARNVGNTVNVSLGTNAGTAFTGQLVFGSTNVAIGQDSLSLTTSGYSNTAIGDSTLKNNVHIGNTAVGSAALGFSKAGGYNTAIGMQAGTYLISGSYNIFVGYNAGLYASGGLTQYSGGNNNIYIGYTATPSVGTTNNEIVIGANAIGIGSGTLVIGTSGTQVSGVIFGGIAFPQGLASGTVTSGAIASGQIGDNHMASGIALATENTTNNNVSLGGGLTRSGTQNTYVGFIAGNNNGIGSGNTAIGYGANTINYSGTGNTAVGNFALGVGYQSNNTGVGLYSLYNLASGNSNVGIGAFAGGAYSGGGAKDNGNNNIYLGANAKAAVGSTDNEIVIGANAIGLGSGTLTIGVNGTHISGTIYGGIAFPQGLASGTITSGAIASGQVGYNHLSLEVDNTLAKTNNHRLSVVSGLPITSGNLIGQTTVYLNPYNGDTIALYDGSNWTNYTTSGKSVSLSLTGVLNSGQLYDIYCYNNAGVPALELSTVWTNQNTRADAIQYVNGVPLKSGTLTRRFVGTLMTSQSGTGVDDCTPTRGLWNWDNRVLRYLHFVDNNAFTYNTSGTPVSQIWRGVSGNTLIWTQGLPGIGGNIALFTGSNRSAGTSGNLATSTTFSNTDLASFVNTYVIFTFTTYQSAAGQMNSILGYNWAHVRAGQTVSGTFAGANCRLSATIEG